MAIPQAPPVAVEFRIGGTTVDVFWTVLAGVAVYVLGQAVVKFFIEPWHEYRMLVGRIAHAMILYRTANNDPNLVSPVPLEEARRELRSLAGELWQRTYAIPLYGALSRVFRGLPSRPEIREASGNLIGLSNSLGRTEPGADRVSTIRHALHMYDPDASVVVHPSLRERVTKRLPGRS